MTAEGLERDLAISYLSRLAVLQAVTPRLGTNRPAGSAAARVFVMGFPGAGNLGALDDLTGDRSYERTCRGTTNGHDLNCASQGLASARSQSCP